MDSEVKIVEEVAEKGLTKGGKIGLIIAGTIIVGTAAYIGIKHYIAKKNNIDSIELINETKDE